MWAPPNRWGARLVTALDERGEDLRARLVQLGLVRVDPQTQDWDGIQELLSLERVARERGRGLWALPEYRVFPASNANSSIGAFNIIEGEASTARKIGGRYFVNFGEDYRTDFTATARSRYARRWEKHDLFLDKLAGAQLRVRGFVTQINGPSIDLRHRLQIELL